MVAVGGDGDGFAIGGGHVPHAARRNVDITYLLLDNGIYGLTKGQTSPTSAIGFKTTTSPYENADPPLNPLLMLLAYGASWVGQTYAGRPDHLKRMIVEAMPHRGFSYLHILSPCVTFDKTHRAGLGEPVSGLLDLLVEPPPLLDAHKSMRARSCLGRCQIARASLSVRPIELNHFTHDVLRAMWDCAPPCYDRCLASV